MRIQTASFVKKQKPYLHLLLVFGVLLYLYSPFLDHWFGNEIHARPHTHAHVSRDRNPQFSPHHETDSLRHSVDQDSHEEGLFCLFDIDALLALLLAFDIVPNAQLERQPTIVFKLSPIYLHVSIIYLASLDPPPNI